MTNSEIQNLKNLLNSEKTFNLGAEILKQLSQEDYEAFYNDADVIVYSGLFTTKQEDFKSIPYSKGMFGGLLHLPRNIKDLCNYNFDVYERRRNN